MFLFYSYRSDFESERFFKNILMSENKSNINWKLILFVLLIVAGIAYLLMDMASSGTSVEMGGSH